ncbi:MAG: YetF domain-containing protein [Egibacteraceae bacterium]
MRDLLVGTSLDAAGPLGMQLLIGLLRGNSRLRVVTDDRPMLLRREGEVLRQELAATRLSEIDLHSAMRAANVHCYADVDVIVRRGRERDDR